MREIQTCYKHYPSMNWADITEHT